MRYEYAALLFVHLAAGILWAGGAIVAGFFMLPAVLEAGPAGGAVMSGVTTRKFPQIMTVAALLVLLSGARLYMIRFTLEWVMSTEGVMLTVAALLAIAALLMGFFVQKPTAMRMGALAAQIKAAGAPPTPEQMAEMKALGEKLGKIARVAAWHLVAAALLMASHRLAVV
ncbi:MAG TPA: hypothetical protein VMV18_08970 [bacterium]|nr:hypothetical protein [bacterium]